MSKVAAPNIDIQIERWPIERLIPRAQRRALVIADNQLAIKGATWDEDMLRVELAILHEEDCDLSLVGFEDAELQRLLEAQDDAGWPDGRECRSGSPSRSRFKTGPIVDPLKSQAHLGDCTDPQVVARLLASFGNLIRSQIAADETSGRNRTLREFIETFRGLSGSTKPARVSSAAGLKGVHLKDLLDNQRKLRQDVVQALLTAMQEVSAPVKADALGVLGDAYLRTQMITGDVSTFRYKGICDIGTYFHFRDSGRACCPPTSSEHRIGNDPTEACGCMMTHDRI